MRISDWSSDVCSSDLFPCLTAPAGQTATGGQFFPPVQGRGPVAPRSAPVPQNLNLYTGLRSAQWPGDHAQAETRPADWLFAKQFWKSVVTGHRSAGYFLSVLRSEESLVGKVGGST